MHNKNAKFNRYKIPLLFSILGMSGTFLFSYLTFIPNQTFAESLIVDPNEYRSLSDISAMQDMSQQICINSKEEETKQLEDTREPGKKYWLTKLKDGNCWMTQNLDYNGGGSSNNSTAISSWPSSGNTFQGYHDPGNYAYNVGSNGQNGDCTNASFTSCSAQFSAINPNDINSATQEKMHYHVGNYYSWSAAMNGNTSTSEPAQGICPINWQLPTSNNINKGSFAYLLAQYGVQSRISGTGTDGKTYQIYDKPLYFAYGGNLRSGKLNNAGSYGNYWSSTPYGYAHAYDLSFASSVNPSNYSPRYNGFSIRCLAEGGGFPPEISDTATSNVSIKVSPVISIEVTKHANNMEVDFNKVARDSIVAKIGSNQKYQVLISTDQPNLEQTPAVENQNIPMIAEDQPIAAGTNSWGIKKLSSPTDATVDENTIYSPVGTGDQKALFYTSTTAATESLTFPVAIAVSPTLPSGQYSTQVTLTAVAN